MKFWCSPETTAVGREAVLPYVPAQTVGLDGVWRFQLLATADAEPGEDWQDMPVPSLWTRQNTWDLPQYTNVQLPFVEQPPYVPVENPTGIYEREFEIPDAWRGQRVVLRVGGFESLLIVNINGTDVGMAKDGRLAADFDITDALRTTGNTLRLRVLKWSDATFIEDQDQWWHGGLPRSISLFATPRTHLARLHLLPSLDAGEGLLDIRATVVFDRGLVAPGHSLHVAIPSLGASIELPISDGVAQMPTSAMGQALGHAAFTSEWAFGDVPAEVSELLAAAEPLSAGNVRGALRATSVSPWSAESPTLYEVVAEHRDATGAVLEAFTTRVGFRNVEVRGRELLVNGAPVMIYGINRHDFHPETGRVLTREDIRADLLELKRWNFNAIRTSHAPNDPALLELADELGFYVVAEANIESHAHMHSICDDPRYLNAFVDRVSRMVQRDLHHPSVILWSLGNESGYGPNHDAAATWVRTFDSTRPLHYEGAIRLNWAGGHHASDIICPMYPSIDAIVRYSLSGTQDRPLIMCEYSHAMGNSNGTLAEYWDAIESHDGLQGGFIWEMWDHGLIQQLPDGTQRYAYGGDFGEQRHDGNFCCDGMFFPDRKAKPALHEFKQIASPVRVIEVVDGTALIENRSYFVAADAYVLAWEATVADVVVASGRVDLPAIGPRQRATVSIDVPTCELLTCSIREREATAWSPADAEVGWAQFSLAVLTHAEPLRAPVQVHVEPDGTGFTVNGERVRPELSLWRPPTDNDRIFGIASRWDTWGLRTLTRSIEDCRVDGGTTRVLSTWTTGAGIVLNHIQEFRCVDHRVVVREHLEVPAELHDIARVGTVFTLPAEDDVEWFGMGPQETYPDRRLARLGVWRSALDELFTDYVRPQESGGRSDVAWLRVGPWRIDNDVPRQVSCINRSDADLADATHNVEVPVRDRVQVHIDATHRGIGTASCGPDTLAEYRILPGTYVWEWSLSRLA